MLYYMLRHRYKIAFIIGVLISALFSILIVDLQNELFILCFLSGCFCTLCVYANYDGYGHRLVCENIEGILKKYSSNQKILNYFYEEYVYSRIIGIITLVTKLYDDEGKSSTLCDTLDKFVVFLNTNSISSYDEVIKNLEIYYLINDHHTLMENYFEECSALDDNYKRKIFVKEEELEKFLEQRMGADFASKTKTAQLLDSKN